MQCDNLIRKKALNINKLLENKLIAFLQSCLSHFSKTIL